MIRNWTVIVTAPEGDSRIYCVDDDIVRQWPGSPDRRDYFAKAAFAAMRYWQLLDQRERLYDGITEAED